MTPQPPDEYDERAHAAVEGDGTGTGEPLGVETGRARLDAPAGKPLTRGEKRALKRRFAAQQTRRRRDRNGAPHWLRAARDQPRGRA